MALGEGCYEALASPLGVRANSTSWVASYAKALAGGLSLHQVCGVAGWSSPHTFVRLNSLDVHESNSLDVRVRMSFSQHPRVKTSSMFVRTHYTTLGVQTLRFH